MLRINWRVFTNPSLDKNSGAGDGKPAGFVVPVSFISDHIETLHEIDVEYKELALKSGIDQFERTPSLNDCPVFLDALADITAGYLRRNPCSHYHQLRIK